MDFNLDLDILGQTPFLMRLYTQISFCYTLPDNFSQDEITDVLATGLERLFRSFPWVSGQVVHKHGEDHGKDGTFKIVASEGTFRDHFSIKDLRNDASFPSMDDLRQANFPFSMLDENLICPRNTIPTGVDESAPIFLVQENLIRGGLILSIVAQHNTMDMTGQGAVIDWYSKACRNVAFTEEELETGNLLRPELVPLLDDYQKGPELDYQVIKTSDTKGERDNIESTSEAPPSPPASWAYFVFRPASLVSLKALAMKSIPSGFVSVDDSLSAFIWRCVTRARLPRYNATDTSTFARAIDVRSFLSLPSTYPGLMQNMTYTKKTFQELVDEPLGVIASQFRAQLDPKAVAYNTRALTTYFSQVEDRNTVGFTMNMSPGSDIMLSSWSKVNFYDMDFGLGLGKPDAVRRPRFIPFESLIYLMPKASGGEIAVAISLRDEDMGRLKMDEEFSKFGVFVG